MILFQELEADFTPESDVKDLARFLRAHAGRTLECMLTDDWQAPYTGIPSHAWLLKACSDAGLSGYEVAVAPAKDPESNCAAVRCFRSFRFAR